MNTETDLSKFITSAMLPQIKHYEKIHLTGKYYLRIGKDSKGNPTEWGLMRVNNTAELEAKEDVREKFWLYASFTCISDFQEWFSKQELLDY